MMKRSNAGTRGLALFQGVLPVVPAQLPGELVAGLTLAALAIPEVMGYTKIAGVPVITGLYTAFIPMLLFAVFCSSRHLVVGADSATAAILSAGLAGLAAAGSPSYVALAGILALMAAGFLLIARVIRLGFLADFLSRTVLIGFLNGVGIQVAVSQIAGLLGLPGGGHASLSRILQNWRQLDLLDPKAAALSAAVLIVIVAAKRWSGRLPGPLIAVVGAIMASWLLDLESRGVHVLGAIPSGLPMLGLPRVELSWPLLEQLLPSAFAMFVVILAQSAATARAYAARHGESIDEDADLVGLAAANLGAGLSGAFVVNGSPTKTQMVDGAGGRSQLAQIITAGIVLVVLEFLSPALAYLPTAVLAAVVFMIGLELINVREMRRIYAERPWEFWVALTTTVVVVVGGVEQGIILAAVLSLLVHTRHGYRPKNVVLVDSGGGYWNSLPVGSLAQIKPGLLVYRFTHSLYYANCALLQREVLQLVDGATPPTRWFCIDAGAIDDVDFSAAETLVAIARTLRQRGIRLVFAVVSADVRRELDRSGLEGLVGEGEYYLSVGDVVNAYRASSAQQS